MSSQMDLDYGYSPQGDLGYSHRAAISFRFGGGKAEALYLEGMKKLRSEDYAGAVLLFDKALTLKPDDARAAHRLKEASDKLKSTLNKD